MSEHVVVDTRPPFWLDAYNAVKNTVERTVVTFIIGLLSVGGVAGLSDFSTDFGKKVSTAALFALAALITSLAWPKAGFGLPPLIDVAARAAFSAFQAGAVYVLANQQLDWFALTNWQLAAGTAIAAGLSVLKGFVALRIRPANSLTPASLASAS